MNAEFSFRGPSYPLIWLHLQTCPWNVITFWRTWSIHISKSIAMAHSKQNYICRAIHHPYRPIANMLYQFVSIFTTMALQMLSFKHTSDTHCDTDISQKELYTYMNESMRTHHTDPHLRATFVLQILGSHLIRTAIQLSGFYQLGNIFTFVGKYMQQAHEVIIIV